MEEEEEEADTEAVDMEEEDVEVVATEVVDTEEVDMGVEGLEVEDMEEADIKVVDTEAADKVDGAEMEVEDDARGDIISAKRRSFVMEAKHTVEMKAYMINWVRLLLGIHHGISVVFYNYIEKNETGIIKHI